MTAEVKVVPSGWRTMESAPRDGTTVLLYADLWSMTWGEVQSGHFEGDGEGGGEWVTPEGAVNENSPDFDPTAEWNGENDEGLNEGPTHWMPLPAAPGEASASPPAETGEGFTVDQLAQEIRRVDGNHSLGAGALAEALMPFLSAQPVSPSEGEAAEGETFYGKDCPVGMVQVEFVGCPPAARHSNYGWKPTKSAFIELSVDGLRYRIDAGDIGQNCFDGKPRRGVHINYPIGAAMGDRSINALNLANPGSEAFYRPASDQSDTERMRAALVKAIEWLRDNGETGPFGAEGHLADELEAVLRRTEK